MLFSGLLIAVDSRATTFRIRTIDDLGIAAYNAFAQPPNTCGAVRGFGEPFGGVARFDGSSTSGGEARRRVTVARRSWG